MIYKGLIVIISIGIFFSVFNNSLAQLVLNANEDIAISATVGSTVIVTPPTNPSGGVVLSLIHLYNLRVELILTQK